MIKYKMDINITYFRNLLSKTVQELQDNCTKWEALCTEQDLSEEVLGDIRTTVGLTKLLINQKLKQFGGLIDDSEFKRSEKEITCMDLQGFWDMVNFEVEKIQHNFTQLENLKTNNWEVIKIKTIEPAIKKAPASAINIKKTAAAKSLAIAARQRIAEAKQRMQQQQLAKQKENELVVQVVNSLNQQNHLTNGVTRNEITDLKLSSNEESTSKQKTELHFEKEMPKLDDSSRSLKEANLRSSVKTSRKSNKDNETEIIGKENILSVPRSKRNIKAAKSNDEKESTRSSKKNGKPKDYGKLQCVTRSATRALFAQQNSHEKL